MRVRRLPAQLPLALLLAVPAALGGCAVLVGADPALAMAVVSAVSALTGVALSRDLRRLGRGAAAWSRDVVRLDRRVGAGLRRLALLEHLADTRASGTTSSHERTSALLAELVGAEERTRSYLAAELHDTVAQTLSQALAELRRGQQDVAAETVEEAEIELRDVLARLRPPELEDGDLAQAVADLCRDLDQRYGVVVAVRWPQESVSLPGPVATTVYRFAQEMLLNAAVHADGADVRLDVVVDGASLEATVSDGGAGFDPSAVHSVVGRHVGLELARERARLAGGSFEVDSRPGHGTRVQLRLPLDGRSLVLPPALAAV